MKVKTACEAAHKEAGAKAGGKFAAIKLDVSDKNAVADLWKDVPQDLRDVDILGTSYSFRPKAVSNESVSRSQQRRFCAWSRASWRYQAGRH